MLLGLHLRLDGCLALCEFRSQLRDLLGGFRLNFCCSIVTNRMRFFWSKPFPIFIDFFQ